MTVRQHRPTPTLDALREMVVAILFAAVVIAAWHYALPWIARWAVGGA